MKLLSTTDYVLNEYQDHIFRAGSQCHEFMKDVTDYAEFLKQPLKLGMFIPCDEQGNVLEEPIETIGGVEKYAEQYQQAKDKVLFKDIGEFEIFEDEPVVWFKKYALWKTPNKWFFQKNAIKVKTIEDLVNLDIELIKSPQSLNRELTS